MAVEWKKVLLEGDAAAPSDTTPENVGTTASAGNDADCSRADHVHDIGANAIDSSSLVADDVIGSEHIEQLSAALDFGGQQAQDVVIHTVADATALAALTPVVGKLAWQTDTLRPYVCTSAV